MFVRVIPEPSLNVKSFLNLSIPLLTKHFVACLVNSGALFINSYVPALITEYGKPRSNSSRNPPNCIIVDN